VSSLGGVTHVPGLMCYLCTRFVPECLLTSACSRRPRGAPRTPGDGEICASSRDTLHQLLLPAGDAGTNLRSRFSRGPARVGSRSYSALLRRKDRWPSAIELRGAAGSDDLNEAV